MPRHWIQLLFILSIGCAPHPRIALPGHEFKIAEVDGRALTLAPPAANLSSSQALDIQFPIARGRARASTDCSIGNDIFNLKVTGKTLSLSMPSLQKWQGILIYWELPDQKIEQKVVALLNAPETLENRGCLAPGSAFALRQILRDAVPMRPGFDLYTVYGYRPGGLGIELKPGIRIKVLRAHFNGPQPEDRPRNIKDLNGLTTVYYEAREDSRGLIGFAKPQINFDNETLKQTLAKGWDDTVLMRQAHPRPVYRLFLLTSFVKKGTRRSALVLGAPTVARMQAMERQIAANPAIGCEELEPAACVSFEGDVSVSPEVEIAINGTKAYVEWNSYVGNILEKYKAPAGATIRLRRMFQGKLVPFVPDTKIDGALKGIVLIGGDELSWQ